MGSEKTNCSCFSHCSTFLTLFFLSTNSFLSCFLPCFLKKNCFFHRVFSLISFFLLVFFTRFFFLWFSEFFFLSFFFPNYEVFFGLMFNDHHKYVQQKLENKLHK